MIHIGVQRNHTLHELAHLTLYTNHVEKGKETDQLGEMSPQKCFPGLKCEFRFDYGFSGSFAKMQNFLKCEKFSSNLERED